VNAEKAFEAGKVVTVAFEDGFPSLEI